MGRSPPRRLLVVVLLLIVVLVFGGLAALSAVVNGGLANPSTIYFSIVGLLIAGVILTAAHLLTPRPVALRPDTASTPPAGQAVAPQLPPRKHEDA